MAKKIDGYIKLQGKAGEAKPSPPIVPVSVFNAALALRNSSQNSVYSGALGGACHVFDPPFSYWCSEHPAGGGGFQCESRLLYLLRPPPSLLQGSTLASM